MSQTDHLQDPDAGEIILKIYLKQIGCEAVNWTDLAQDREFFDQKKRQILKNESPPWI